MNFSISLSSTTSWPNEQLILQLSAWDRSYFPTPWTLEQWLDLGKNNGYFLIMSTSGFALFRLSCVEELAHLLKIVILPSFRKQKIGKTMLVWAFEDLKNKGIKRIFLEVEESNLSAKRLYDSLNFLPLHRVKNFYGHERHAWTMEKSL